MEAPATPLGFSVGFATELARRPSLPFAAQWAPGIWAGDQKPRIEFFFREEDSSRFISEKQTQGYGSTQSTAEFTNTELRATNRNMKSPTSKA